MDELQDVLIDMVKVKAEELQTWYKKESMLYRIMNAEKIPDGTAMYYSTDEKRDDLIFMINYNGNFGKFGFLEGDIRIDVQSFEMYTKTRYFDLNFILDENNTVKEEEFNYVFNELKQNILDKEREFLTNFFLRCLKENRINIDNHTLEMAFLTNKSVRYWEDKIIIKSPKLSVPYLATQKGKHFTLDFPYDCYIILKNCSTWMPYYCICELLPVYYTDRLVHVREEEKRWKKGRVVSLLTYSLMGLVLDPIDCYFFIVE